MLRQHTLLDHKPFPSSYLEGIDLSDAAARQAWEEKQMLKAHETYHRVINENLRTEVCACCCEYVAPVVACWHPFDLVPNNELLCLDDDDVQYDVPVEEQQDEMEAQNNNRPHTDAANHHMVHDVVVPDELVVDRDVLQVHIGHHGLPTTAAPALR